MYRSHDITELISMTKKELLNISNWLRINKLSASPQTFMVIGHQRRVNGIIHLPLLNLDDSEITRVRQVKSFAVIVDEGLKWKNQLKSKKSLLPIKSYLHN